MNWENVNGKFGNYVQEAWDRNFSLKFCRKVTNRLPSDQNENLDNNQEIITVDLNLEKTLKRQN